jgi:S1-C subfamily serine protease
MADARQAMFGRHMLVAAVALLATPATPQALDVAAPPSYGTVQLSAGFIPDPHIVALTAGGPDRVPTHGAECVGFVNAAAPDLDLHYQAGDYRLFIHVDSRADTTLVINAPDGSWHCSDDALGLDPLVDFATPLAGLYSIWVGAFDRELPEALLYISERDPRAGGGGPEAVADARTSGSGFFVSTAGHLLTNEHVAGDCRTIEVADHGPARLVLADADVDLALLHVERYAAAGAGYPGSVAVIATSAPRLGADVVLLGYPLAHLLEGSLNVTTGVVSGLFGLGRDERLFQLTAPLQQGNSGGPVLDEAGHVLGVAVAKLDEMLELERSGSLPQNINFAIRSHVVLDFLARADLAVATAGASPARSRTELSEFGAAITAQVLCER